MRARALLACTALLAAVAPATAQGLAPGTWDITWLEPRLTPASKAHATQATRCYSKADAARGSNPVMPPAQEQGCKTTLSVIGGDLVYDTECNSIDHRLRLFACGTGYCGVYRYSARNEKAILESIVIIRPKEGRCERS